MFLAAASKPSKFLGISAPAGSWNGRVMPFHVGSEFRGSGG